MELLRMLAGPLVGCIIGLVTNWIAIKMLFRPYNAIYIRGRRLPFTPGIVAARKEELAAMLGTSIVKRFFNADDLEIVFTSDYLRDAFADKLTEALLRRDVSLGRALNAGPGAGDALREEVCVQIQGAILRMGMGPVVDSALAKVLGGKRSELLSGLSADIARRIERFVLCDGYALIRPVVDEKFDELLETPVGDVTGLLTADEPALHAFFARLYSDFMSGAVRHIVETIDVGGMIADKVRLMSVKEIETLVLSVVNRELMYVVYLGGGIGAVIGIVNSLLSI